MSEGILSDHVLGSNKLHYEKRLNAATICHDQVQRYITTIGKNGVDSGKTKMLITTLELTILELNKTLD